jgi:hypothetical protein
LIPAATAATLATVTGLILAAMVVLLI